MNKYTLPTVVLCAAFISASAQAQDEQSESNPRLQLNCQGSIQCSGSAVFQIGTNEDVAQIQIDLAKRKTEKYILTRLNKQAFPQKVSEPSFTIESIKSADITSDETYIYVKAEFVTTGDLEGTQTVSMRLKNGSTGNIVFPVKAGSLKFQLSGMYKHLVPASLIPNALLTSARKNTEKMVTDILKENLSKRKLFAYLNAPASTLNGAALDVGNGRLKLNATLALPKSGSNCAYAWAQNYKQISLAGGARMTVAAEGNWTGKAVSAACDTTAAR